MILDLRISNKRLKSTLECCNKRHGWLKVNKKKKRQKSAKKDKMRKWKLSKCHRSYYQNHLAQFSKVFRHSIYKDQASKEENSISLPISEVAQSKSITLTWLKLILHSHWSFS